MTFPSVLYPPGSTAAPADANPLPNFFEDLNLDQIVQAACSRKPDYDLAAFYTAPCENVEMILYRQAVFQDLEKTSVHQTIREFSDKMVLVRRYQAMMKGLYYKQHMEGWFVQTACEYCDAVIQLNKQFGVLTLNSQGLLLFKEYLGTYVSSASFSALCLEAETLKRELDSIQYNLTIKDGTVKVRKYNAEMDYSQEVENIFSKFKQKEVRNYWVNLPVASGMNHVGANILECVAKLYPNIFTALEAFCARYPNFIDEVILIFDRQIQFFVAWLDLIQGLEPKGLSFCYPVVSTETKNVLVRQAFDLALANKRITDATPIVSNDIVIQGEERVLVVSGPNQGGKTTYARMFGQLHYLSSLGCPIPGKEARLTLPDHIFTHFEKEEDIRNLRGKLQDDLVRIHAILDATTGRSIVILNEIFTSTSLQDALFLSKELLNKIIKLDVLCVWVTFVDELSTVGPQTVSMVSTVFPNNPTQRTFKILRQPADGLSYALHIAEKNRVTYEQVKGRISS